jgi:hypothetical protein
MSSFYAFASDSPITAIFLAYCALTLGARVVGRTYRTIMVCVRGWPPAHLDADGDWKEGGDDGHG